MIAQLMGRELSPWVLGLAWVVLVWIGLMGTIGAAAPKERDHPWSSPQERVPQRPSPADIAVASAAISAVTGRRPDRREESLRVWFSLGECSGEIVVCWPSSWERLLGHPLPEDRPALRVVLRAPDGRGPRVGPRALRVARGQVDVVTTPELKLAVQALRRSCHEVILTNDRVEARVHTPEAAWATLTGPGLLRQLLLGVEAAVGAGGGALAVATGRGATGRVATGRVATGRVAAGRVAVRRAASGTTCPYCRDPLGGECVACEACGTSHHTQCWTEHGSCTVLGCERSRSRARVRA